MEQTSRSELVSFDMPALASSSQGRFSGQVALPAELQGLAQKDAMRVMLGTELGSQMNGVGVAVWPSKAGAILYSGEVVGTHMNGIGLIEFPSARSTWSMASGKFENGAFSFGLASAGDVLDFVSPSWQRFILSNIQASTSWTASEFKGQWKHGCPSQGITILPDGSKHVGAWKDGKFHDSCLFVDESGNWIKGFFNLGELVKVMFRSEGACRLPPSCEHLLAQAEVATIAADMLQGEYKSFVEIADKLAVQGVEMSKLAKSISNIAHLKSEQVLGLPTHAVESTLNGLARIVQKSQAVQPESLPNVAAVPHKAPDVRAKAASALAALTHNLSAPNQQQALHLLMEMQKRNLPGALGNAVSQALGAQNHHTLGVVQKGSLAKTASSAAASPLRPTATKELGTNNVVTRVLGDDRVPHKLVGLLSVNPPVMTIKRKKVDEGGSPSSPKSDKDGVEILSQTIKIEGWCKSLEILEDISILCISGDKYVRCDAALEGLTVSANIHSETPVTNFQVSFSFKAESVGITHFLLASKASQQPFSPKESSGPCEAELAFGAQSSNYYVLPLLVLGETDGAKDCCGEITASFQEAKKAGGLAFQRQYERSAGFLQRLGTVLASPLDGEEANERISELSRQASDRRLPLTYNYLRTRGRT